MSSAWEQRLNEHRNELQVLIKQFEDLKELNETTRDDLSQKFNAIRSEYELMKPLLEDLRSDNLTKTGDLNRKGSSTANNFDYSQEALNELTHEEAELEEEKNKLLKEEEELQVELLHLMKDRINLEKNEDDFWNKANQIEIENIELEEESSFTRQQIMAFNSELERLSKIYILNEVFDIKIHNDMATISKLHIGKNPDTGNVNWDETNAAFGHTLLLLNYLCVRNGIKIPNVEFDLLGNVSSIRLIQRDRTNDCKLAGPPQNENEFNIGLVKLASCVDYIGRELKRIILSLKMKAEENTKANTEEEEKYNKRRVKQLVERLGMTEEKLNLPMPIDDGRFNGKNDLRYGKNLVDWTRALRFLMEDCKHLILMQNILDGYEISEQ